MPRTPVTKLTPAAAACSTKGWAAAAYRSTWSAGSASSLFGGRLAVEAAKAVEQIVLLVLQGSLQLAGEGGLDLGQGGLAPLQQGFVVVRAGRPGAGGVLRVAAGSRAERGFGPGRRLRAGGGSTPVRDSAPAGGSGVAASSGPAGASVPGACTRVGPGCGSLSARSDRPARIRAKSRSTLLPRPEAPGTSVTTRRWGTAVASGSGATSWGCSAAAVAAAWAATPPRARPTPACDGRCRRFAGPGDRLGRHHGRLGLDVRGHRLRLRVEGRRPHPEGERARVAPRAACAGPPRRPQPGPRRRPG